MKRQSYRNYFLKENKFRKVGNPFVLLDYIDCRFYYYIQILSVFKIYTNAN